MTDYRINQHDCPGIDSTNEAAVLDAYRALLEHEVASAERGIAVYRAWQDVMLLCEEGPLSQNGEDEDRMACDPWVNADHLPYCALLEGSMLTQRRSPLPSSLAECLVTRYFRELIGHHCRILIRP